MLFPSILTLCFAEYGTEQHNELVESLLSYPIEYGYVLSVPTWTVYLSLVPSAFSFVVVPLLVPFTVSIVPNTPVVSV